MRTRMRVPFYALLLCGGVASAQTQLPTVEVRAGTLESVMVSCAKPDVSPQDVERVLSIDNPSTTPTLRRRLITAVSEACKAGIPHILVKSGPNATLTWKRTQ